MDLVPKPGQVVSAAGNVAHLVLHRGVADLRPMPRTLLDEAPLRAVHHYDPDPVVTAQGDPVLLVPPLAAPASAFDLRRGCSVVEHLVGGGRPTYLVEYGEVSLRQRSLGLERWVRDVVPTALRQVSEHAGGRPVHLVGWSLGGLLAMLAAADGPDLPIASLTVLGTPVDTEQVPMVAPVRPLLDPSALPRAVTGTYRVVGAAAPVVGWGVQLGAFQRWVTRPAAVATHLDDRDWLAQLEAVDRFRAATTAYRGRSFGQLFHRFAQGNALAGGSIDLGERRVDLASLTVPTFVLAGATDGIAPVAAVRAALPLLTGAREQRFEIVPGGHLGLLTGRAARETTWPALDGWLGEWDGQPLARPRPARKAPATKAPATKTPAKKAPAKRAASQEAIGSNPQRRYSSAGSRALGARD